VHTTTANEHDSKGLATLLEKIPDKDLKGSVFTDKGYKVPDNDGLLKERTIKNRVIHKAYGNRPLTHRQVIFNRLIAKTSWVVECTFGSIKKWFNGGKIRYIGLQKTYIQHVLQDIAYNLKRSLGIILPHSIR
jgi:IS5 family transposase